MKPSPLGEGSSLSEQIRSDYDHALVVRFDPWLISGRNDLITQFISELIRTIKSEPKVAARFKVVTKILIK